MLELIIYGLMGLAAMLVIAFFSVFGDEFPPAQETPSFKLINKAHLNVSQMIESGTENPQFRATVRKQEETASSSLLQTTSPAEPGPGAIYSDSVQGDGGQVEVFHG